MKEYAGKKRKELVKGEFETIKGLFCLN